MSKSKRNCNTPYKGFSIWSKGAWFDDISICWNISTGIFYLWFYYTCSSNALPLLNIEKVRQNIHKTKTKLNINYYFFFLIFINYNLYSKHAFEFFYIILNILIIIKYEIYVERYSLKFPSFLFCFVRLKFQKLTNWEICRTTNFVFCITLIWRFFNLELNRNRFVVQKRLLSTNSPRRLMKS